MRMIDPVIDNRPDFCEIRDTIFYFNLSLDEKFLKDLTQFKYINEKNSYLNLQITIQPKNKKKL